jgi:hypothetical protein
MPHQPSPMKSLPQIAGVLTRYLNNTLDDVSRSDLINHQVKLFNPEQHSLYQHQVVAIRSAVLDIVLSQAFHSGYCFMPTSAGKGHIIITLAGLAVGDFRLFRDVELNFPQLLRDDERVFPWLITESLNAYTFIGNASARTHVLVHDVAILQQIEQDCHALLPPGLGEHVSFFTVQAHRTEARRNGLKYVIIDEAHWGNATQDETIQSDLVQHVKDSGGKAFGFTASPYEHPDSKFQRTWSSNKINADRTLS